MRTKDEIESRIRAIETYIDNMDNDDLKFIRKSWRNEYAHKLRQQVCELKWVLEPEGYDPHEYIYKRV